MSEPERQEWVEIATHALGRLAREWPTMTPERRAQAEREIQGIALALPREIRQEFIQALEDADAGGGE